MVWTIIIRIITVASVRTGNRHCSRFFGTGYSTVAPISNAETGHVLTFIAVVHISVVSGTDGNRALDPDPCLNKEVKTVWPDK